MYFCRLNINVPSVISEFSNLGLLFQLLVHLGRQRFVNLVDISEKPTFGFIDFFFYCFSLVCIVYLYSTLYYRLPCASIGFSSFSSSSSCELGCSFQVFSVVSFHSYKFPHWHVFVASPKF